MDPYPGALVEEGSTISVNVSDDSSSDLDVTIYHALDGEKFKDLYEEYSDIIKLIKDLKGCDKYRTKDWVHNYSTIDQQSTIENGDSMHIMNQLSEEDDMNMEYSDSIYVDNMINIKSKEKYDEYGVMSVNSATEDTIELYDECNSYDDFIYSDEHLDMKYSDSVKDSVNFTKRDKCHLRDRVNIIREE